MKIESSNDPKFIPTTIVIESLEEAQALVDIFSRVGGSQSGPRRFSQKINDFLSKMYAITYISNEDGVDGHVYFKS